MKNGCKAQMNYLEETLERKLTQMEHDMFEYAYDKGYQFGYNEGYLMGEDEEPEWKPVFKMDANGNLTRVG